MGKFFKALEQAEREREHRKEALRRAVPPREESALPSIVPNRAQTVPVDGRVESTFRRPAISERVTILPVGEVPAREVAPESPGKVDEHLVSLLTPTSYEAEQYRSLRHKVEELHKSAAVTVVGVSSPESGDGKTITVINLAGAMAQSPEARILIVDADLRRSSITQYLGLDAARNPGLVGAILDPRLSLKDVAEPCAPFNLSVVHAGRRDSAPYELLKSPRLGQLLAEARQDYDYVLLDMPPLIPLPDCSVIGLSVDGFLVVVSAHKTQRKLLKEALSVLDPTSIIGLIFNVDDRPPARYYNSYAGRPPRRARSRAGEEAQ